MSDMAHYSKPLVLRIHSRPFQVAYLLKSGGKLNLHIVAL